MFDALAAARARGVDLVIVDTAGRLHTRHNLMEELKKVRNIVDRQGEGFDWAWQTLYVNGGAR